MISEQTVSECVKKVLKIEENKKNGFIKFIIPSCGVVGSLPSTPAVRVRLLPWPGIFVPILRLDVCPLLSLMVALTFY